MVSMFHMRWLFVGVWAKKGQEIEGLPFQDLRKSDGRLFAAYAADVPALQPAETPLNYPVELGSLTCPLAFTKVEA